MRNVGSHNEARYAGPIPCSTRYSTFRTRRPWRRCTLSWGVRIFWCRASVSTSAPSLRLIRGRTEQSITPARSARDETDPCPASRAERRGVPPLPIPTRGVDGAIGHEPLRNGVGRMFIEHVDGVCCSKSTAMVPGSGLALGPFVHTHDLRPSGHRLGKALRLPLDWRGRGPVAAQLVR
jgi:hypothetical protein